MGLKASNGSGPINFHSEYVTLSQCLRELLSLKNLIKEVVGSLNLDISKIKFVSKSTVYEDNQGVIQVDTSPRMTHASKHLSIKYHWFREHVGIDFDFDKVKSVKQKGGFFTKGLQGEYFRRIGKSLCGW